MSDTVPNNPFINVFLSFTTSLQAVARKISILETREVGGGILGEVKQQPKVIKVIN